MKTRYPLAKISNFAKVKGGKRLPKTHNFASGVTPHLYIKARDIGEGRINITEPSFLYEKTFNLLKNYIVNKNDVCITIVGANIGDIGIIPEHLDGANLTENAAKVTELDGVNPLFLKYALMTDALQSMMKQVAAGSAQAKLGIYKIEALTIPKPPLAIQDKIADILSKYDDLIENNRRRIELLEESARSLYREWFVYLRFPGHEHIPIIDGIPEGWKKGKISDLGEIITGKTPSKNRSSYFGGEIPFVKTPDMHDQILIINTQESLSEEGAKSQPQKFISRGSVLVSCIGTVGVVAIASSTCQTNQQINSVVFQNEALSYYSFFALKEIKSRLEAMGGGATMVNVNKHKFSSIPIIEPIWDLIYC